VRKQFIQETEGNLKISTVEFCSWLQWSTEYLTAFPHHSNSKTGQNTRQLFSGVGNYKTVIFEKRGTPEVSPGSPQLSTWVMY